MLLVSVTLTGFSDDCLLAVEDELLDVESENSLLGLTVSTSGLSLSPSPSTSGMVFVYM